jgi:hypothetical protein
MLELVRELAVFEKAPNEVTVTEEHMLEAGFGKDPVWVGWVAEVGGGSRVWRFAMSAIPHGKGAGFIWRTSSLPKRLVGGRIGDKLFRQCADHAVNQNYSGMLWQVLDWNVDAHRFYDRFGSNYSKEWWNGSLELEQLKNLAAQ